MTGVLLKKIGEIVGLDLPYFFRSGKWVFFRYIAISGSGLMLNVVFTRFADKEVFGQFQFVLATLGMLSVLSLPGLNTVSMREAANGNFGGVKKSVYFSFLFSLSITVLGAAWGLWILWMGDVSSGCAVFVAAVIAPFFYAPNNWYVFYESGLDFRSTTVRIIFSSVLTVAITSMILVLEKGTVVVIVATYLGVQAVFGWIYFVEAAKKFAGYAKNAALDMKYGIACTVQKFTGTTLNENLPVLVITAIYGFQNLALFQVAYFCFASLGGFFGSLASTYLPLLFKYRKVEFRKVVFQNFVIGGVSAIFFFVAVWFLFIPVFGAAYRESFSIALALSMLVPLIPVKIFLSSYYSSRNKNGFVSSVNALSGLVALFLLWLLRDSNILFATVFSFGIMYIIQVALPLLDHAFFSPNESGNNMEHV